MQDIKVKAGGDKTRETGIKNGMKKALIQAHKKAVIKT